MKVVQINSYGKSDLLEVNEDVPAPSFGQNQVLVEVIAASINPFDLIVLRGNLKMPLKFPITLGGDFAGIVSKLGSDTTDLEIGDEVYGQGLVLSGASGAFAEYVVVNSTNLAKKPKNITFIEAAGLPLVGSSAVQALEEHIKLQKNQKILIHGGAGGIGHIAIQLAKALGAYVATTVSSEDMGFAAHLGADMVIDYKNQAFEKIINNYDAVFDTVGGEVTNKSFMVLTKGGTIVSMKGPPDLELARKYGVTPIGQITKTNKEHLERLRELVESNKIKVNIDKVFPMTHVKEAFEYQEKHHPRGKVILQIK